jgi:hemerythrin-like domain-containing protein
MKRSPELAPLSRDHHQALVVAQQLRRATDTTVDRVREAFLSFWDGQGRVHFRVEEEVLLPAYAAHGDPYEPVVARVLCDHVLIRKLAAEAAGGGSVELMHDLGTRLNAHVRLEERELFPMIESALPSDELIALGVALDEAERASLRD